MIHTSVDIPSRQEIYDILCKAKTPLADQALHSKLDVTEEQSVALGRRLDAMVRDGELVFDGQTYCINTRHRVQSLEVRVALDKKHLVLEGFEGEEWPTALPKHLFPNDILQLRCLLPTDKAQQKDLRVVSAEVTRRTQHFVGTFDKRNSWVRPHADVIGEDILVHHKEAEDFADGAHVVVEVLPPRFRKERLRGQIISLCRHTAGGELEIESAAHRFGLPVEWSRQALEDAQACQAQLPTAEESWRVDLRDKPFVTIDGEDAKDFDDAILVEKTEQGMRLSVAIADVSSYVVAGSDLDREAYERGNSVYFPRRVIPMLPPVLSENMCSLQEAEDRLALVCQMTFSSNAEVTEYSFFPALIRSQARLTYSQVHRLLKGQARSANIPVSVVPMLRLAFKLWKQLDKKRLQRGAVELDIDTGIVHFDTQGKPQSIKKFERNNAHRLIEEFMICANVSAAKFLNQHQKLYLRRTHQGLKLDGQNHLNAILLALKLKLQSSDAKGLVDLLEQTRDHKDRNVIHTAILRNLARAEYSPLDAGHFCLALKDYAHFTSPIRRYPDLIVHRAIYDALGIRAAPDTSEDSMYMMGQHCSETEQRADVATRDIDSYFKCCILKERCGESVKAVVTAVTSFGLFVTLDGLYADGLIHISDLGNEYFVFDETSQTLRAERGGKAYGFGMRLTVKIARVDIDERQVSLIPVH